MLTNSKRIAGKRPPIVIPRPFSEASFLVDFFYLILISSFQLGIFPTFIPYHFSLDLLTPWVAFGFVISSPSRAISLALVAAFTIESHSAAPSGLYVTAYWMMGMVIVLSRHNISWNGRMPWASVFLLSQTWVFIVEFLVVLVAGQELQTSLQFYFGQAFRIISATLLGLLLPIYLASKFRSEDSHD